MIKSLGCGSLCGGPHIELLRSSERATRSHFAAQRACALGERELRHSALLANYHRRQSLADARVAPGAAM
jgi:hypothetical protein